MARDYHILDVFTEAKLAGNPLAVVLDAAGLDDAAMAKIAREFNLSETVFIFAPRDPVNIARVRIFTPARELPFAGHPTVGTAILLAVLQAPDLLASQEVDLVLEEAIGPVRCTVRHRRGQAAHARFEVPRLAERDGPDPAIDELAALFGLEPADIGFAGHHPSRFSAGVPFVYVPVTSLDVLGRARPRSDETEAYYLYTPFADEVTPRAFRARMFAGGLGVVEDPATGSAAAGFAGVLLAQEALVDGAHDCVIHQGVEMGRPSRIGLAFRVAEGRLTTTTIGGHAVMVARGTLEL